MLNYPSLRVLTAVSAACLVMLSLSVISSSAKAGTTELVVRCVSLDGKPVKPDRAELLLSGWGFVDTVPLEISGEGIVLPLDESGLRALAGENIMQSDEFFIYIEAAGYVPVRSMPVQMSGGAAMPADGGIDVAFPNGARITVRHGETRRLDVGMRRPAPRFLQLVGDDRKPVAGVEVISYMYWSSSNHCARLNGARELGRFVSDAQGLVSIPDQDAVYAFEIAASDMGLVLAGPELPEYPERLIATLKEEKTEVKLHLRKSVTLTVRVTKNGVPVPGETLYGCMADCPGGVCASCCGPLLASDAYGVIVIPGFYPEAYTSIYFPSAEGGKIFEADPRKLPLDGPIAVDLASCAITSGVR